MLIGIVGKTNVGKSTFFKASTLAEVEIAPHPFTTIKPNEGVGWVRIECVEKEFGVKCNPAQGFCINSIRFVPIKLMDVAGLVPGAHLGKGLGLQFLDNLRQADCLIHILDASGSTNEKGEIVTVGSYDPIFDVRFLEIELDMWIYGILHKAWEKIARQAELEATEVKALLAKQLSGLKINEEQIKLAIEKVGPDPKRPATWRESEQIKLASELRRISKPMIIAANKCDLPGAEKNIERLKKEFPEYKIIPCSAEVELALKLAAKNNLIEYIPGESDFKIKASLSESQLKGLNLAKEVLNKWHSTGLQQALDSAVFELLNSIAVWPVPNSKLTDKKGNVLPDCFIIKSNSTTLDLAYAIHTDIGKNFLKAIDVRTKKVIGKEAILKHNDVIEIVTK